ncbi:MAG: DNA modification methylase [Candidatus Limnocylindrales bacterium]
MKKITWHTEERALDELIPSDYNPREISEKELHDLQESVVEFGEVMPLVINIGKRKGTIIGGHQRLTVYDHLGIQKVKVMIPNRELTLPEERRLNLRLNRNQGRFDFEKLKMFDLNTLLDVGFDDNELHSMFDDVDVLEDNFNVPKALKEIKKARVKMGEKYALGEHRLMIGDSTNKDDVHRLMSNDLADVIYCDPPYNIGLDYSKGMTTDGKYQGEFTAKKDNKKDLEYTTFIGKTIENAIDFTKKDAHVFYWCDERYIWLIQTIFAQHGITNKRVCLWIKNNFNMTPQVAFNKAYEPCVYGTTGKPKLNQNIRNLNEILNKEIESGNQVHDEITDLFNIWLVKRDNTQNYEHPTQKPVSLNEKPIKRCSIAGQIILDLFGGSGSTLIAAEQLHRRAYLMEHDPVFGTVILDRWEAFTGKKAKKL